MAVTGASLTPILQRLNSVSGYHPFEADAFGDWATEAGDVIQVSRNGTEYSSPLHSTKMVWKGTPEIQLSSTGQQERTAVSKVSRQKYRRGSAAMRSSESIHRAMYDEHGYLRSVLDYTESHLYLAFTSADNSIRSALEMTESRLRTGFEDDISSLHSYVEQTASHWYSQLDDTANSLHSYVDQTASHWVSELTDDINNVSSHVEQTASAWRSSIEGVAGPDGRVTAATIAVAINAEGSQAIIDADKVYIGNSKSTTVINGKASLTDVNATYIQTKILELSTLNAVSVAVQGTLGVHEVQADRICYRSNSGGSSYHYNELKDMFVSGLTLERNGDTYTLKSHNYNQVDTVIGSFSRATTLSGEWSGRNYNVTATPQGNVKQGIVYDDIVPDTSEPVEYRKVGNNHYVERYHYVYSEDEEGDADAVILHKKVGILANAAYEAGYTAGSASGGSTTLSASWTGSGKITVTASPQGETLERLLQAGVVTWNGTRATIPISSVYGSSGQYSDGVVFSPYVDVSGKLQTMSITSNGTVTPDSGYIGFSQVTVDVPTTNAKARFNVSSGEYYIEAYDNQTGNPIYNSSVTYKLGISGTKVQIQNNSGSRYGSTPEFTIPLETRAVTENGTYTPTSGNVGISSISVNVPSYDSAHVAGSWGTGNNANVWTVSKTTSGSANNVSMTVTAGVSAQSYNSSTHKYTAYGYAYGNGTQKASSGGSESGTEAYNDGWAAARGKVSVPTATSTSGSIAVKYPATAVGDQGTTNYYPSADNSYAYIRVASATGTAVARVSHSAYANGWSGCYGTVGLDSTTAKTLGYGESVTVYAQAKASSGAGSKTNVASRKITAPADRYYDGYDAGVTFAGNSAWFEYTSTRGSDSNSSFIDISNESITRYLNIKYTTRSGSEVHRRSLTWYLPKAQLYTVSSAGSTNTELTPGTYICAGYTRGGYSSDYKESSHTYHVPSGGSSPSYSVSIKGKGNNATSGSGGVFTGYTTHYVSSMPSRQPQAYQYILFTVDGKKHAFYW